MEEPIAVLSLWIEFMERDINLRLQVLEELRERLEEVNNEEIQTT